jgi:hypothetical protein
VHSELKVLDKQEYVPALLVEEQDVPLDREPYMLQLLSA